MSQIVKYCQVRLGNSEQASIISHVLILSPDINLPDEKLIEKLPSDLQQVMLVIVQKSDSADAGVYSIYQKQRLSGLHAEVLSGPGALLLESKKKKKSMAVETKHGLFPIVMKDSTIFLTTKKPTLIREHHLLAELEKASENIAPYIQSSLPLFSYSNLTHGLIIPLKDAKGLEEFKMTTMLDTFMQQHGFTSLILCSFDSSGESLAAYRSIHRAQDTFYELLDLEAGVAIAFYLQRVIVFHESRIMLEQHLAKDRIELSILLGELPEVGAKIEIKEHKDLTLEL